MLAGDRVLLHAGVPGMSAPASMSRRASASPGGAPPPARPGAPGRRRRAGAASPGSASGSRMALGGLGRVRRLAARRGRRGHRRRAPDRAGRRLRHGRGRRARGPVRAAGADDRPGPARALAPHARAVAAVPARGPRARSSPSATPAPRARGAAPARPAAVDLPGRARGHRRRRRARRRRRHLLPQARRRMAYETWWSVHLYTYLALFLVVLPPGRHGRVVRRPPRGPRLVDGALGGDARARGRLPRRAAAVALAAPPPAWSTRSAGGPGHVQRDHARPAAAPAAGGRRPVPAVALPAPRAVVAGAPVLALGRARRPPPAPHRQGPRRPQRRPGPPDAGHPRGHRRALRRVHRRPAAARSRAAVGAGVGITPVRALLEELPDDADVVVILRGSTPADLVLPTRSPRRSRAAAGACTRSSARASAWPSTPARCGLVPDVARATSTSAAPSASRTRSDRGRRAPASPTTTSTGILRLLMAMRRAPIVLAATAAGFAAHAGFHAHTARPAGVGAPTAPPRRPPRPRPPLRPPASEDRHRPTPWAPATATSSSR